MGAYKRIKVYVAGGWFNENQLKHLRQLEDFVTNRDYEAYLPRVDNNAANKSFDSIFFDNVYNLQNSDLVIASTVDKDMGTLWECGYAYANYIPVIYYTPGIDKVNLMLAKSGHVARTLEELDAVLKGNIKEVPDDKIE